MVSWRLKWRRRSLQRSLQNAHVEVVEEVPESEFQRSPEDVEIPDTQSALLLHAIRQPYELTSGHSIPTTQHDDELLVKVQAVGLNPIDWKAPYVHFSYILRELYPLNRTPLPTNEHARNLNWAPACTFPK